MFERSGRNGAELQRHPPLPAPLGFALAAAIAVFGSGPVDIRLVDAASPFWRVAP